MEKGTISQKQITLLNIKLDIILIHRSKQSQGSYKFLKKIKKAIQYRKIQYFLLVTNRIIVSFFKPHRMGNTCISINEEIGNQKFPEFPTYNPTQIYDNPHRSHLDSNFLQSKILRASNYIMEDQMRPRKTVKMVKMCSINSDMAIDDIDVAKVSQTMIAKHRLPSIKVSFNDFITTSKKKFHDEYKIIKKIGAGSFGQVFKAQNIITGDIRAIKAIRKNQLHKHQQQIEILKNCDHPNIIQLFQVIQQQFFYYVVMEYCPGGSIIQLIKQKKYMYHEDQARTILEQILHALVYLHDKGIVHRDIKLENVVFMQPNPGKSYTSNLKIIDFGNAQRLKYKLNVEKKLTGTTVYMPPQAFAGWFTQAFDLWSCGVLLYILLAGSCPFKGKYREDTIQKIKNQELNFQQSTWKKVSGQAKQLIMRLLNKDFRKRPTASQCLNNIWFQPCMKRSQLRKASQKFTKSLSKYYSINNFVSVVQSYLAFLKMSQSQKNQIKQLFQAIDIRRKGFLTKQDIEENNKICGELDEQILSELFQAIDKNKSGCIEYSQFQTAMSNRQKLFIKESLKAAFQHFDTDGSGYIEKGQLIECLKNNSVDVNELILQIDKDHDHRISKEEFLSYFQFMQKKIDQI